MEAAFRIRPKGIIRAQFVAHAVMCQPSLSSLQFFPTRCLDSRVFHEFGKSLATIDTTHLQAWGDVDDNTSSRKYHHFHRCSTVAPSQLYRSFNMSFVIVLCMWCAK